ncbi:MAG: phytoene desaturase family protein [Solirubrobacterales bacterium]
MIAAHLLDVICSHGGAVRTRARVERILTDDGRARGVRLLDGEEIKAPVVVSGSDLKRTYLELLGADQVRPRTLRRVERMRMALPIFCVYLGLDFDLSDRLQNSNYYLFGSEDVEQAYSSCYRGIFPTDPPLYLSSGTLKDPHNPKGAPAGCSTLEIMTVAPAGYSEWRVERGPAAGERYSRNPSYRAFKERAADLMIEGATKLIPDLRDHIIWSEAATPITHERYTLASGGTAYGLEHSPQQWGLHRPRARTEIEGLYLAGASTFYAHGVLGVMLGGVACAGAILARDLRREIERGAVFADIGKLSAGGEGWDPLEACRRHSDSTPPPREPAGLHREEAS